MAVTTRLTAGLRADALVAGTLAAPALAALLAAAGPAAADGRRPVSVTVTADADRNYDVSVGTKAPRWWMPSVGTTVDFEVAASHSPAAGRARSPGDPSGTIWGVVTLPPEVNALDWDTTVVRVQVNPDTRERTLSVSGAKTWKLGKAVSASLEDTYTLTHQEDEIAPEWEAINAVRFEFKPTKTALVAQNQRSRDDGDWHTSLRAEQQIADGFSIAASVSDVGTNTVARTILASFSREW